METKKTLWLIASLTLFVGCAFKPSPIVPSLKFKERVSSNQSSPLDETPLLTLHASFQISNETAVTKPGADLEELPLPKRRDRLTTKALPPPVEEKKEEKQPLNPEELLGVRDPVLLNVESMPLNDFIVYALGELLKVAFLVDDEIIKSTTPITLRMPQALPPAEVLQAVVSHLERLGFEVSQRGRVLHIAKPKPKPAPPPPRLEQVYFGDALLETSAQVAQFVPLRYVRPHEVEHLLRDLLKETKVEIRAFPKENALLLIGPGYQMANLLELLRLLDTPYFFGKNLFFYRATYWQAEELAKEISSILGRFGYSVVGNVKEPGIMLFTIRSLNSLVFAFPEESAMKFTLEWLKRLDTPESAGTELRFYFYRPLYSRASDLAESLGRLLGAIAGRQAPQPTPQPALQPQPQGAPQRTTPQAGISFTAQGISLTSDDRRNLLLIQATPTQYSHVMNLLRELDKPPKQVLIEATILELTLKDELKFGLEWFIRNRLTGGNYTLGQILGVSSAPGLTFSLVTDARQFNLLLNFFAGKGLTNILSTPRLLTLDNQPATIQVGTDVPVVTGEVTTVQAGAGANPGVVRSIQYRHTGVILNVRPTVYTEGLLQLEITQEVSEMGSAPPGLASPTILVRKITTNVVAGDGQMIALGGLMSTTRGKEESKVPFLGDLPLLGNLFKSQSHEERKTELLVLLRPYVVKSVEEARLMTEELLEGLKWLK